MIHVVGIGPGNPDELTPRAAQVLEDSDIIVGYKSYIKLLDSSFGHKNMYASPMKGEVERCRYALQLALEGKKVALVSSGDAGVYGMAGLMLEILDTSVEKCDGVEVEIVPGITAASSAAAILGAPLMHDFAVVSLSDLLTPWDAIENRLFFAAKADFVLCLYNPASRTRTEYLQKACDIVLKERDRETPCGWVRNAGRDGQSSKILSLGALRDERLDMFCTVFIGNSSTRILNGKIVTPRGYETEKGAAEGP